MDVGDGGGGGGGEGGCGDGGGEEEQQNPVLHGEHWHIDGPKPLTVFEIQFEPEPMLVQYALHVVASDTPTELQLALQLVGQAAHT